MRFALACALAALLPVSALAADVASKPPKLGLCAGCHGEAGHANAPEIPNLAGQNLPYLRSAIAQYKSGKRDFPAMRAALGMLNAAEVDAILSWYARQPAQAAKP